MKKSRTSLAVFLFLLMSLGMPLPGVDASSHGSNNKSAIRKCGGLYKGNWLSPKCENTTTGNVTDILATMPVEIRIPRSGKGTTKSRIDVFPELGGPNPSWVRVITRFKKPNVRKGGKLKIYRGMALFKHTETGTAAADWPGTITVRVLHKDRKYVIEKGNFQFYYNQIDRKYSGKIKARK